MSGGDDFLKYQQDIGQRGPKQLKRSEVLEQLALHGSTVGVHVRISGGCKATDEPADFRFNGLAAELTARRTLCGQGLQHAYERLTGREFADEESLAYSESVDQLAIGRALKLRPYVRFEQGVYDAAAAFVVEHFGGKPFLALHWRRTDFLSVRRSQPGVLQSPRALIAHARRVMEARGLEHVYLSTDCDDEAELREVAAALPIQRYAPAQAAASLRQKTVSANVEIAICAMAARFLGTRTSSFTLAIIEERSAVFGQPEQSSSEMGELPVAGGGKDEL